MIDSGDFFSYISGIPELHEWLAELPRHVYDWRMREQNHGLPEYESCIWKLGKLRTDSFSFTDDYVTVGSGSEVSESFRPFLLDMLWEFKPWKKGPFSVFGIKVESEWRSDFKWNRLQGLISPLAGRKVFDAGCGNGYHLFRYLGAGAELAAGCDPSTVSAGQFHLVKSFIRKSVPAYLIPLPLEDFPAVSWFDTVFSMGVIYHRRSPVEHLEILGSLLRSGGELVLETLIVPGDGRTFLVPKDRYAKMPNIWFIPSIESMRLLLERTGFRVRSVSQGTVTTADEQRRTEWMDYESLDDFLMPGDRTLTVEGYPAPCRAIFVAEKQ